MDILVQGLLNFRIQCEIQFSIHDLPRADIDGKQGVVSSSLPVRKLTVDPDEEWIVYPEWVREERIRDDAAQPLHFRGETLGVLEVWDRTVLSEEDLVWLRVCADQAAVSIVNARAFEEIASLKERLELENNYLREEVSDALGHHNIIGTSPRIKKVLQQIQLAIQAKLLRVLQEQEIERVGDSRTRKIDVRIVAATNRDLKKEADLGRFRQYLFYRLSVFPLEIPPLRERRQDIPLLAANFIGLISKKMNRPPPRLTKAQADRLSALDWQGNVRELQNTIERAMILAQGSKLDLESLLASNPGHARPSEPRMPKSLRLSSPATNGSDWKGKSSRTH